MKSSNTALRLTQKEAEDGVLGALLIDNNTFDLIGGKIDSEDFYDYGNRLIFENIKRLLSQGKPADILTVHDILREGGLEKRDRRPRISQPTRGLQSGCG